MFKSKKHKKRKLTWSKPWTKLFKEIARASEKSKKAKRRKTWTGLFGKKH